MNLIEKQKEIESLSDEALMREGQAPTGQWPGFLVMSELQRRGDLRKRYQAQQAQQELKKPSVLEQKVEELRGIPSVDSSATMGPQGPMPGGGVPAMQGQMPPQGPPPMPMQGQMPPQMPPQGPPQPQMMAGGGMVRGYADGGPALPGRLPGNSLQEGPEPEWMRAWRMKMLAKLGIPDSPDLSTKELAERLGFAPPSPYGDASQTNLDFASPEFHERSVPELSMGLSGFEGPERDSAYYAPEGGFQERLMDNLISSRPSEYMGSDDRRGGQTPRSLPEWMSPSKASADGAAMWLSENPEIAEALLSGDLPWDLDINSLLEIDRTSRPEDMRRDPELYVNPWDTSDSSPDSFFEIERTPRQSPNMRRDPGSPGLNLNPWDTGNSEYFFDIDPTPRTDVGGSSGAGASSSSVGLPPGLDSLTWRDPIGEYRAGKAEQRRGRLESAEARGDAVMDAANDLEWTARRNAGILRGDLVEVAEEYRNQKKENPSEAEEVLRGSILTPEQMRRQRMSLAFLGLGNAIGSARHGGDIATGIAASGREIMDLSERQRKESTDTNVQLAQLADARMSRNEELELAAIKTIAEANSALAEGDQRAAEIRANAVNQVAALTAAAEEGTEESPELIAEIRMEQSKILADLYTTQLRLAEDRFRSEIAKAAQDTNDQRQNAAILSSLATEIRNVEELRAELLSDKLTNGLEESRWRRQYGSYTATIERFWADYAAVASMLGLSEGVVPVRDSDNANEDVGISRVRSSGRSMNSVGPSWSTLPELGGGGS